MSCHVMYGLPLGGGVMVMCVKWVKPLQAGGLCEQIDRKEFKGRYRQSSILKG